MKRSLLITLLLTLVFAAFSFSAFTVRSEAASTFSDTSDHWAKEQIAQAVAEGYVSGYLDGTFQPDRKISRAEFIRMLVDALKLPHVEEAGVWYQPYVAALIEVGIHKEADFKADYDTKLTRLELVRLAVCATDVMYQTGETTEDQNYMVFQATEKGILHGKGAGELDLSGTTTRAQAVATIERILSVNAGQKLPVDKYAMSSAELSWHRTNVFTVMPEFFRTQSPGEVESGTDPIHRWDVGKMTVETPDGKYKGTMDRIIAIDFTDPKDPNRYLLGDIERLKWYAQGTIGNGIAEGYPLKPQTNSYILYFDGHLEYSKDTKLHQDEMPGYTIFGQKPTDKERTDFMDGKLNKPAQVFITGINDFPALIIPKTTQVKFDYLMIQLYSPSHVGVEGQYNVIIHVAGPSAPNIKP